MSDPFFIPPWAEKRLKAETEPKALTPEQTAYAELARAVAYGPRPELVVEPQSGQRRPGRPKGSKNKP